MILKSTIDQQQVLAQLDQIADAFADLDASKRYNDFSGLPENEISRFQTLCLSAIDRIAGAESAYARQAAHTIQHTHLNWPGNIPVLFGITQALRADVVGGYLVSIAELIHAGVFADFLEMAEYLLQEGYKDAAAVMVGGVLEGHLQQLCLKAGIDTEVPTPGGGTRPKKADTMNADLARAADRAGNERLAADPELIAPGRGSRWGYPGADRYRAHRSRAGLGARR